MKYINFLTGLIFLSCCFSSRLQAQEADDELVLSVRYDATFRTYEEQPKHYEDEKVLEIGKNHSIFYGFSNTRRDEVKDSIVSRGGTLSDVLNAYDKLGLKSSKQNYKVLKNFSSCGKLTYTDVAIKSFKYVEDMERPSWKMLEGDTVVCEYPCQKAQTLFRGRTWTVWFTPEIPISEGPWKLYGLPGLIVQAADTTGSFTFQCTAIRQGKGESMKKLKGKFINCTPSELREMHALIGKDPMAYAQKFGVPKHTAYGPDGKAIVYKEKHCVFMELLPEK